MFRKRQTAPSWFISSRLILVKIGVPSGCKRGVDTCAACWMDTVDSWCIGICGNSMREVDIEIILERAKEKYLEARPRIISDNGPQFIARDFKE